MGAKKLVLKPALLNQRLAIEKPTKEQLEIGQALKAGKNILVEGSATSGKSTTLQYCLQVFLEQAEAAEKKRIYRRIWGIAPNRYRVDNLNLGPVIVKHGMGRLFRTPAGIAFALLQDYFQKAHPKLPLPRLFTGDQEAAKIAQIITEQQPQWVNIPNQEPLQENVLEQLRNLYDTCSQWGISTYDLDLLGRYFGKTDWQEAANKVFTYYQPQGTDQHWNQSSLQARAIEILGQWHDPQIDGHALDLPELLVVDDLQDMPASTAQLILALAEAGVQVVAVSNPKMAVENYRGGNAENQCLLLEGQRHSEILRDILAISENERDSVCNPASEARFTHYKLPDRKNNIHLMGQPDNPPSLSPEFLSADSADNLCRNIAIQLRNRHIREGISWNDMAVILRNRAQAEEYRAGLENYDIPVLQTARPLVFRDHFTTGPLLHIFYYAQQLEKPETAGQLPIGDRQSLLNSVFTSDYLKLDSYQLCKLKQGMEALNAVRIRQETIFSYRNLEQFLATLGTEQYQPLSLPNLEPALVEIDRLHQWIWQARQALKLPPLEGIDRLWQKLEVKEYWRKKAIAGDKYFDEALDGVNALYAHAQSWQEGHPDLLLSDYLQVISQQTGPVDTLAKFGQSGPGVQVLTFAAAAGRIFDTVVVAGVQEGAWPNPSIRNQLFDSGEIRNICAGKIIFDEGGKSSIGKNTGNADGTGRQRILKDWRAERKAVIEDEKMLFETSCARAENKLFLAAIDGEEELPSVFYDRLRKKYPSSKTYIIDGQGKVQENDSLGEAGSGQSGAAVTASECPHDRNASIDGEPMVEFNPATMRELVGQLRYLIAQDSEGVSKYAMILALLKSIGVESADPENWRQYGGTEDADFYSAKQTDIIASENMVSISPSRLAAVLGCPLRSFLEQYQGSAEVGDAASVGTALHAVAEKMIDYSPSERREAFFNLLPEPKNNWIDRQLYQKYEGMISRLNHYLDSTKNRKLLGAEKSYRVNISDKTVLNLRIDRMEEIEGKIHIVDFKTGKPLTAAEAQESPQLGCYQLAVGLTEAEMKIGGAALVYLSEHAGKMPDEVPKELSQPPLAASERENLSKTLENTAEIMRRPYLLAVRNPSCQHCKMKRTCPISGEGAQLW